MSDSEDEGPDKQLKLIVMGDGASGKVRVSCYDCLLIAEPRLSLVAMGLLVR